MKITKTVKKVSNQIDAGILSIKEDLRALAIASVKELRPDIFERLSDEAKYMDSSRNKKLNEEQNKYIR